MKSRQADSRDDLFFRIAVALIKLPPLRIRMGDFTLLVDHLLERINNESATDPAWEEKSLSPSARNQLQRHAWPGNIRELTNTLTRAAVWSAGSTITGQDIAEAFLELPTTTNTGDDILNRPIEDGIDLPSLIQEVASHYLRRSLDVTAGNKRQRRETRGLVQLPDTDQLATKIWSGLITIILGLASHWKNRFILQPIWN